MLESTDFNLLWLNASWMEPRIPLLSDLEMRHYELWLCKLSAACWVLIIMLCLTEQLLKWPKGPGKRKPSSQPCAHASFSRRLFWCYLVLFHVASSLLIYQVIGFSRGWKLQSLKSSPSLNGLLNVSLENWFFWKISNLVKSTSMAKFLQGPHFISRFSVQL